MVSDELKNKIAEIDSEIEQLKAERSRLEFLLIVEEAYYEPDDYWTCPAGQL